LQPISFSEGMCFEIQSFLLRMSSKKGLISGRKTWLGSQFLLSQAFINSILFDVNFQNIGCNQYSNISEINSPKTKFKYFHNILHLDWPCLKFPRLLILKVSLFGCQSCHSVYGLVLCKVHRSTES
jgi:hypothetical protein